MNTRCSTAGSALLLALLFGPVAASQLAAQPPDAGRHSAAEHQVVDEYNRMVAVRDGVELAVDVFRPKSDGRFPGILCQTPYDKSGSGLRQRARWFAERGYVVVMSDVRGRYESQGDWDPFGPKHKTDGYDLVEWLAKQAWSSGKVGTFGASYMGWTQWWTANAAPPSLKAIVPEVAPPDQFYNAPYQQGVLAGWMMDWAGMMSGHRQNKVADGPYGGFTNTRFEDLMRTPYIQLDNHRRLKSAPWFDVWIQDNLATSDYWKGISYQGKENYSKVQVPSLAISGWFDANFPGTPMNYVGMKQFGATPQSRRPRLVIGPWEHSFNTRRKLLGTDYGPQAMIDWNGYVCRWFDHHLKGVSEFNDPPVHVFVMGRNKWYAEQDWPLPQTVWTRFYLHSGGKANTAGGDGSLSIQPPGAEPADAYVYDPANPTRSPMKGGHIDGPEDTRAAAEGRDVLVYTTPPLTEAVEVTGPITAKLFAATTARDTDWMVRLVDVHPDGYAALLCDGVLRARCRDAHSGAFNAQALSTIEPDKTYPYEIEFWRATGNVFLTGHRIRVEISSSYFPYYLRNLNTGDDNVGLATSPVVATQTIYHDAEHPSHVVLPVIPRRD